MTSSFPQQGELQGVDLCEPAQQVACQIDFVPRVIVEDLRRVGEVALTSGRNLQGRDLGDNVSNCSQVETHC